MEKLPNCRLSTGTPKSQFQNRFSIQDRLNFVLSNMGPGPCRSQRSHSEPIPAALRNLRRMKVNKTDYGTEKAGFVSSPKAYAQDCSCPFLGRSKVYCLTMTLLTVCPSA